MSEVVLSRLPPEREVVLATVAPESEVVLALPEPEQEDDDDLVHSALSKLRALDPVAQSGLREGVQPGTILLPGRVPLLPLTFASFVASTVGLGAALLYFSAGATQYTIPLAVAHAVFLGQLWFYHLGYRTRRRFLAFRQAFFIAVLMGFLGAMLLDLVAHPPALTRAGAGGDARLLYLAAVADFVAALIVLSHWAVLGRGARERAGEAKP